MVYLVILSLFLLHIGASVEASQCPIADTCVTDLSQEQCGSFMVLVPNLMVEGCCPGCQMPNAGGGDGDQDNTNVPCQAPNNCLPDGSFAAVQCKGDLFKGRCFCSDKNGHRIFGQMWRNEASEMTCDKSTRQMET